MFNFKDLADINKISQEAKRFQEEQERSQKETVSLLKTICQSLEEIKSILKSK